MAERKRWTQALASLDRIMNFVIVPVLVLQGIDLFVFKPARPPGWFFAAQICFVVVGGLIVIAHFVVWAIALVREPGGDPTNPIQGAAAPQDLGPK
jgi:hypothetical protein